jgi:hypothetical protein
LFSRWSICRIHTTTTTAGYRWEDGMAVLRRALSAVLVELRDEQDSRRSYAFLSRAGSLDRQEPKRRTKSNGCSRSKGSDPRAEKHVAAGPGLTFFPGEKKDATNRHQQRFSTFLRLPVAIPLPPLLSRKSLDQMAQARQSIISSHRLMMKISALHIVGITLRVYHD